MNFTSFLVGSELALCEKSESVNRRYHHPNEVLNPAQWETVKNSDFFKKHINSNGSIMVRMDDQYHNTFRVGSTRDINTCVEFHITRAGSLISQRVLHKCGHDENGKAMWL